MRYQPLDTLKKNSYVHNEWTDNQLKDYMRYYSNNRFFSNIPFNEYKGRKKEYKGRLKGFFN